MTAAAKKQMLSMDVLSWNSQWQTGEADVFNVDPALKLTEARAQTCVFTCRPMAVNVVGARRRCTVVLMLGHRRQY